MGESKWQMIDKKTFVLKKGDYQATVLIGGSMGVIWTIRKGDIIIDLCYYYPPTDNELAGRVQCEKVLNKILADAQG